MCRIKLTLHSCIRYEQRFSEGDTEEGLIRKASYAYEYGVSERDIPNERSWDKVYNLIVGNKYYYGKKIYVIKDNTLVTLYDAPEWAIGDLDFALAKKGIQPQ